MKLVKPLFFLAGLILPVTIKAQAFSPDARPLADTTKKQAVSVNILGGSANAHYIVLAKTTFAYRQPADTLNGQYARKLRKGTKVYISDFSHRGGFIRLEHDDGKRYYLPAKSVKGLTTFVEI